MIHIHLDNNQLNTIKKIWASWFFKRRKIAEFIQTLEHDNVFRNIIFVTPNDYANWKSQLDNNPLSIRDFNWQIPIINYFFENLSNETYVIQKYKKELTTDTRDFLLRNYNSYRDSSVFIKIIDIMNIHVCPYCNRNFIESYSVQNQTYFKGDLDHHYSKDEMPALMLSFFNLIPCCKVCNHEKLNSTQRPFYPYYDHEEMEYHFSIELLDETDINDIVYDKPIKDIESKRFDSTVWQGVSDNFKIKLRGIDELELNERMKNSNTLFRLEKKYNHSKEYVQELIRKKYIYPEVRKKELLERFSDIFRSESDLTETFYSYSSKPDEFHHRPLSKLTKDVLNQLDALID